MKAPSHPTTSSDPGSTPDSHPRTTSVYRLFIMTLAAIQSTVPPLFQSSKLHLQSTHTPTGRVIGYTSEDLVVCFCNGELDWTRQVSFNPIGIEFEYLRFVPRKWSVVVRGRNGETVMLSGFDGSVLYGLSAFEGDLFLF